jgi:hypothetical protein
LADALEDIIPIRFSRLYGHAEMLSQLAPTTGGFLRQHLYRWVPLP